MEENAVSCEFGLKGFTSLVRLGGLSWEFLNTIAKQPLCPRFMYRQSTAQVSQEYSEKKGHFL